MTARTPVTWSEPCQFCGRTDYPHECWSFTVLNSRYYCPDGEEHDFQERPLWFRGRCRRCGELVPKRN